ncbi:uncharacterized protein EV154DRAFT_489936 [Mucor mucedo]|uniref:uncharacterized protein n=1 Tax=Mucor mucedo TaxID=29922 RepID=UPI0022211EF0|nr:uncharacterized protein EV154DRAFT_489936 [Mucor mucedo]KAI7897427.1 hypothetical protein EV154DRAFT_489936 [Mucor mucedo]
MFDAPPSTILNSLNNLLENPKQYLADVCFTFSSIEIWAHRAIILARAPKEFVQSYLPELLSGQTEIILKLDMNNNAAMISAELFSSLLRFWYTASYYQPVSPHSSISELSIATPPNASPSLSKSSSTEFITIQNEIEQLGIQLGTALLPLHCESVPDFVQLVADLKRMRDDKIATDVTISLISNTTDNTPVLLSTSPENHTHAIPIATFRAHRFLLAAQSTYFYALFCTQFQEAKSHTVHFTDDLFNESIIDMMLNFFYTDKIIVSPLKYDTKKPYSPLQRQLEHSKHALRVIQKAFYSADYLGHSDSLGQALLFEMENVCHQFKCVCPQCAVLLPSMLAWSDKHVDVVPKLKRTLILLFSEPVHSLASLWSQRPFALLVSSMVPSSSLLGEETLVAVKRQEPLFRARAAKTLVHEIVERTFYNVTKHNAIHVLHSIHLCLSQSRSADPNPSWSRPTLSLVNSLLKYTIDLVCQFFDFYCVEYPILLSCVDGIGAGFSVDFLDFLLRHVLQEGIQTSNAGVIYQVIVRDLVGRQEVVRNMAVDDVLTKARIRCATYIAKNWTKVKSQGGFRTLDKSSMRQLADDINIPYRNLTKPYETEFANIFSFKPKKSKKIAVTDDKNALLTEVYTRRLSLGNLMTRASNPNLRTPKSRPRALSTESVLASGLARYNPPRTTPLENQPLINLLSHETDERRKALEEADIIPQPSISATSSLVEYHRPLLRTSSSFTSLTDQLLPVDCVVITPPPSTASSSTSTLDGTVRPSRLKFELPTTPARSKSPSLPHLVHHSSDTPSYLSPQGTKNRSRRGSKTRKSRWSIGSSNYNSDISDDDEFAALPVLGNKIELLRRPLPTMGTIKYIGPVRFAEGTYIGVELESRLGKSDGSVDGIRYFHTDPQRALFVKPDDFKIVSYQ